jgi:hypothetical protein
MDWEDQGRVRRRLGERPSPGVHTPIPVPVPSHPTGTELKDRQHSGFGYESGQNLFTLLITSHLLLLLTKMKKNENALARTPAFTTIARP